MITASLVVINCCALMLAFSIGVAWERRHWRELMRERDRVAEAFLLAVRGIRDELIHQVRNHGGAPWLN